VFTVFRNTTVRTEAGVVCPLAGTLVLVVHGKNTADSLLHAVCHTALPEIPVAESILFFPSYFCDLSVWSPRQAITVIQSDMSLSRSAGESEKKEKSISSSAAIDLPRNLLE
jgi:hypothetical protein